MFRPPRHRRRISEPHQTAPKKGPLEYRNPIDDAGEDDAGEAEESEESGIVEPETSLQSLKKLAIEFPLALLAEGAVLLIGIGLVVFFTFSGCG